MTIGMGITREDNGRDISTPPLYLSQEVKRIPREILTSERIGIPNKGAWTTAPLRYTVKGNSYVSKGRKRDAEPGDGWLLLK